MRTRQIEDSSDVRRGPGRRLEDFSVWFMRTSSIFCNEDTSAMRPAHADTAD